ncbi:MAG: penicillin-insensitive murein endopeptidase [Deltaproteobacteria bacterium]|nr:penicillin-insensitive murein endopeptidase [Deltaproteobacteria bacterium]
MGRIGGHSLRWRVGALVSALALSACFDAPTPLAPTIRGSVGVPHHGTLTDAKALPRQGPGFVRFRGDAIRWGNPRLVEAIMAAAAEVEQARPGGAPLVIADLSAKRGGKIPRHRSHRNGRDLDLLFYVVTPNGRSVRNPGFIHFGHDGLAEADRRAGTFLRLDVDRTWLLVKALTSNQGAQVQWLFVARWLEALLIEHARARGEDDELVWHAQNLLRQPGDSSAHDDHIHMRIACAPAELASGCRGGGYYWPWFPPVQPVGLNDDELLAALFDDEPPAKPPKPVVAPKPGHRP